MQLPLEIEMRLKVYIDRVLGRGWLKKYGERMRQEIIKMRNRYWNVSGADYGLWPTLAYLVYHFPAYCCQMIHVYEGLLSGGLLKKKMNVLEIGAGTGAPARAFAYFLPEGFFAEYDALEPSDEGVKAMRFILENANPSCRFNIIQKTVEDFVPEKKYDLIIMANVLSELKNAEKVILTALEKFLVEDGSLLIVEPAELRLSTHLREIQRRFHKRCTIWGPCVYLWGPRCEGRCWSFVQHPDIKPTKLQRMAAHNNPELINKDIKYSYVIFRKDGKKRCDIIGSRRTDARMMDMMKHVGKRINITCARMSGNLSGVTNLFKVCDGSARREHYAVLSSKDVNKDNRALIDAEYGEVLRLRNVLVMESEDNSYHLVIGKSTKVERIKKG